MLQTTLMLTRAVLLLAAVASATTGGYIQYLVDGHVTPCWKNSSLSKLLYCDMSQTPDIRSVDLVSRLTLQEKLAQIANGGANWVPRLGIDLYQYHSEGLHGVRTSCNDIKGLNPNP